MFGDLFHDDDDRRDYHLTDAAAVLSGLLLGAAAMYLFDPVSGRRRRAVLWDRVSAALRQSQSAAGDYTRYATDHVRGLAHEARARMTEGDVPDPTLVERVRSQMGRAVSRAGAIRVEASGGVVTLRGPAVPHEADALIRTVRSVRGVREVRNELDVREDAGDTAAAGNAGSAGKADRPAGG